MYVLVAHQSAPCDCFDNALTPPFKSMSYLRYLFTILLTLTMFYGWASPSVATSQFVCRGVGLTEPERSSLWNLSDVSTLDKAGLNLAPRYVATSVHDGDSVRTIISEIIDGRRMRYLVDGSNLIWIGEETPEMHIRVDTLCYTSALLPFGDVSIPLSLHYRSNVIRSDGALVQSASYYPYGEPHRDPSSSAGIGIAGPDLPMSAPTSNTATASTSSNPYLYGGKEYVRRDGLREYVYGARMFVSSETRFNSMDRLCEKHPDQSPYLFCGGNPIRYVDPTGNEWKYVSDESAEEYNTFVWVDAKDAYDKDGNLLPDHYVQAISFSANGANGEFNPENNYNMSTSTATVYKADGSTENFDACTNPSNPDKYATVPAGRYEAKVGLHKGSYTALRMGDVGTKNFAANTIELGEPNPSNKKTTKAAGINIHKPGRNNLTGMTKSKKPVSMGCFLIDQNKWTKFISIFTAYHDKLVGIIVNR